MEVRILDASVISQLYSGGPGSTQIPALLRQANTDFYMHGSSLSEYYRFVRMRYFRLSGDLAAARQKANEVITEITGLGIKIDYSYKATSNQAARTYEIVCNISESTANAVVLTETKAVDYHPDPASLVVGDPSLANLNQCIPNLNVISVP